MNLFFKRTVIFVVLLLNSVLFNQLQAQRSTVTLQILIDSVTNHLPILLQKQALINSANASVTDVAHTRLPSVKILEELSGASSNNVAGVYFPMSTIPSVSGSIRSNNKLNPELGNIAMLYGEYDLIDFGLSKARIATAKSFLNLVKSDYDRQLYLLKWQASTTYLNLLKTEYQLNIDQQNINRYLEIYKVIQTLTINGIRPGVDSSQLIAEISKTRMNFNITLGKILDLQQQLYYYSGINSEKIIPDSTLNNVFSQIPNITSNPDLSHNPFSNYFKTQFDYYKSNYLLLQKSYQPRIVLLGGLWGRGSSIQYNDQYKGILQGLGYQRFNYGTAVSFVYNFVDAVHRRDKMNAYKFRISAADFEIRQEEQDLNNSLQQANNAINTSDRNLKEVPIQLQSAKDAFNQKLAQYNAGIINLIDLTNASFILYRAQSDYVQLLTDWYIANLNKAAVSGNLDNFIQTIKK